jgi:hypothetical protein
MLKALLQLREIPKVEDPGVFLYSNYQSPKSTENKETSQDEVVFS